MLFFLRLPIGVTVMLGSQILLFFVPRHTRTECERSSCGRMAERWSSCELLRVRAIQFDCTPLGIYTLHAFGVQQSLRTRFGQRFSAHPSNGPEWPFRCRPDRGSGYGKAKNAMVPPRSMPYNMNMNMNNMMAPAMIGGVRGQLVDWGCA